jgi:hypothetical protein
MTREEAKEYLSAVRPHGADAADPTLQQALELAKKDSELGSWLARQQEFDQILIEKFSLIRPPEGLKENILESLEEATRPIQSWRMGWLALAATVVLAALLLSHRVDLFLLPRSHPSVSVGGLIRPRQLGFFKNSRVFERVLLSLAPRFIAFAAAAKTSGRA